MADSSIHEDDPGFEEFIEGTLKILGERAQEKGICIECLSDRLKLFAFNLRHIRQL